MSNAPKDASAKAERPLDDDLDLEQADTDAVGGSTRKGRDGRAGRAGRASRAGRD